LTQKGKEEMERRKKGYDFGFACFISVQTGTTFCLFAKTPQDGVYRYPEFLDIS
jgi:hypothetical protein